MTIIKSSLILAWFKKIFTRDGALEEAFARSSFIKALDAVVLAIPRLFRAIYKLSPELWERSKFIRLIRGLGNHPEYILSWFIFALMILPQELWGNSYIFVICVILILLRWFASGFSGSGGKNITDTRAIAGRKLSSSLSIKKFGFWLTAWALLILIYVPDSYSVSASLRALPRYLSYLFALYVILTSEWTLGSIRRVIKFILFGLVVVALYAIIQRLQGLQISASYVDIARNPKLPGRVYSFFENPNALAFALIILMPFTLPIIFYTKGRNTKYFAVFAFLMSGAALLMTYSRGPWVAFLLEAFIFLLIMKPRFAPYLIAAGIIALPILPRNISSRIFSIFTGDSSLASRMGLYGASISLIMNRPLGAGLGLEVPRMYINFNNLYEYLKYRAAYIHAHNIVLQIINEVGFVGLIAFFGTLISGVKNSLRAAVKKSGEGRAFIAAGAASVFGMLFCGIVDYPLSYARVMLLFWIMFGITIASARIKTEKTSPTILSESISPIEEGRDA